MRTGLQTPFNTPSKSNVVQMAKPGNRAEAKANSGFQKTQKAKLTPLGRNTLAGAGGVTAGVAGTNLMQNRKKPGQISKADWMNISEHQRRSRDARRTRRRGEGVAGLGGATVVASAASAKAAKADLGKEVHEAARTTKNHATFLYDTKIKGQKNGVIHHFDQPASSTIRNFGRNVKANPRGFAALAGGTALAGGVATMGAARLNEKRHDHAVAQLRKQRGMKQIAKAYDPERNRRQRLDRYSTAAQTGAGALGAGALYHGGGAVSLARKGRAAAAQTTKAGKASGAGAIKALGYYKSAGKAGGKALGFGVGAVGATIAADRIKRYKKGRGAPYGTLRLTDH